jgi:Ca-activated chloride channel family protein
MREFGWFDYASAAACRGFVVNDLLLNETRKRKRLSLKMRLARVVAGLAALLYIVTQAPRFLLLAATQPEKITVTVPVVVTDSLGRYVSGLEKEHFKLYEDRIEQEIGGLINDFHAGVSVVVVVNGITQDPATERALNALTAAGHPGDELELVRLNDGTGLMDGLHTAIERSRSLRNVRRGIMIVFLGSDTPVYSQEETKATAASTDVPIYALSTAANTAIKPLLDDFARLTGGRHDVINNASDLDQPIVGIAVAIRNSYVLTYDSANVARDGGYRRIRVKVVPPNGLRGLNVGSRDGYFAPRP